MELCRAGYECRRWRLRARILLTGNVIERYGSDGSDGT